MSTSSVDQRLRLFADNLLHDGWAQQQLIASVRAQAPDDQRIRGWLSHVTGALGVWLARVRGEPVVMADLDRVLGLDELAERHAALTQAWLDQLAREDLDRVVRFTSRIAGPMACPMADIMAHLATHGAHHRGQVCARLVDLGRPAPTIDRIFWKRSGS